MKSPRVLIYDCEIENCILGRGEFPDPEYKYCNGWHDFKGMGISVIGAYDYGQSRYRVFCKNELNDFAQLLKQCDCIVGFNSKSFDDKLMLAHGIEIETHYDLLQQVRIGSGQPENFTRGKTRGGYKLEDLSFANLGHSKSGDGAMAPKLWQGKQIGRVIDYCLKDVWITKNLLEKVQSSGCLTDPNDQSQISVPKLTQVWARLQEETSQVSGSLF